MIEGVAGIIIWTERLEEMSDFYRNALGIAPHSVRPDFVAFRWGAMRLSIGAHDRVKGRAQDPHRIMVNLSVADIHAAHDSLRGKGVRFVRPPEREHWGGYVATLKDPDGNLLQLMQLRDAEGRPYQG